MPTQDTDGWVSLRQAALLLGLSEDTVRRRIRDGKLEARLVHARHGPAYEVRIDGAAATALPALPTLPALVAELHRELLVLAERCGRQAAELEQARARIRELEG